MKNFVLIKNTLNAHMSIDIDREILHCKSNAHLKFLQEIN